MNRLKWLTTLIIAAAIWLPALPFVGWENILKGGRMLFYNEEKEDV